MSNQENFNLDFINNKVDTLIHLNQWQYWWWFWFGLLWVFYFFIFSKLSRYRTYKFRPKIATTLRPRGKWGDLIVCLLPISWCINILINSNFLLKLIEWQNESSLFTIRIRGKQWYWVYKYDLKNFYDIINASKNIGKNRWFIDFITDVEVSQTYQDSIQLRSQNSFIRKYWTEIFLKQVKEAKFNYNNGLVYHHSANKNFIYINKIMDPELYYNLGKQYNDTFIIKQQYFYNNLPTTSSVLRKKISLSKLDNEDTVFDVDTLLNATNGTIIDFNKKKIKSFKKSYINFINSFFDGSYKNMFFGEKKQVIPTNSSFQKRLVQEKDDTTYQMCYKGRLSHGDNTTNNRFLKKSEEKALLSRVVKTKVEYPIKRNIDENDLSKGIYYSFIKPRDEQNRLLKKTEYKNMTSSFPKQSISKDLQKSTYFTFKQKRYKKRKNIVPIDYFNLNNEGEKVNVKKSLKSYVNRYYLRNSKEKLSSSYNVLKKNKTRNDNIFGVYNKRLLRTNKILVLPSHVNITAITNSYDVIHSWFVPGLGLKLDCIPGRSTHHTFFIDNIGFYYGQCAEVCGRYHHHMPIKLCAIPYEHFLVWWHSFGLPKLMFTNSLQKNKVKYAFRKFTW